VEAVIGVKLRDLEKDIAKHFLRRDTVREIVFDVVGTRAALKTVAATEAEVQVHLANLLVATQKPDEAELAFLRVQAVMPEAPAVKEWLARRELRANRPEEAARLYREAIGGGSRNSVAFLVSAEQRLTDSRSSNVDRTGGGGRDIEESLAEIRQAIRLNPGSIEAYRLLGRALFLHPKPTKEHAVELSRGVAPGAEGGAVQFYRALLYERLEMNTEYGADLAQLVAAKATSSSVRRLAKERLESEGFRRTQEEVEKLAKEKNYAEARAVVAKARQGDVGRETDQHYEAMTLWLTEKESWETLSALASAEKWTEVRTAAKRFLEEFPRSRVADDVRKLDGRAKAKLSRGD
jgi:tetratricopeptide (TPR) repeat protein